MSVNISSVVFLLAVSLIFLALLSAPKKSNTSAALYLPKSAMPSNALNPPFNMLPDTSKVVLPTFSKNDPSALLKNVGFFTGAISCCCC